MKYFVSIFLCLIFLCGCSQKTEDFFAYQKNEISFDCTLSYNGHENDVKITMSAPDEKGERETVRVEYTSPKAIKGYTLEKSGGQYKGKMGNIEIPFGEKAAGVVKAMEYIFSLSEEMLSGIDTTEEGLTQAEFACENITGKVIMNEKGELSSIEGSFADGDSICIKIKEG